jgi:DNA-binding GntR family transcriptional regulator
MLQWFRDLWVRWGLLSPPAALNAAVAMAELRASKQRPADDWESLVRRFHTKVFAVGDRKRVWRQYRRKYPGNLHEWGEIPNPTSIDQECLTQILDELAR